MKNLVVCGNCQLKGTKSILGEIDDNGYFAILRFHNGYTRIKGSDFAVICGNCGEENYIRKEAKNENSIEWKLGVYRETFIGTFGTLGLQGTQIG